jgi:molybdate transport system substrate-binding protein
MPPPPPSRCGGGCRDFTHDSADALKCTLLQAKSIAYSASASGVNRSTGLFQRLGIAAQVVGKRRKIESERIAAVVARGDAEIGFRQISKLLPVAGIDYVGPLPPEVERVTVFSAGVAAGAGRRQSAHQIPGIPAVAPAIRKSGMDPF